ncbi:polysaccharide deacetylase family protein [Aerococcaceae bacterium DSM 111022]|nr:polysaccharide deacetylase family protein [Aerococcaceae bacterium DSM 111022]MBG9989258.1 polysaccharide deacetylase family protein [Aerococcaceae bacterium DSM 111176]
MEKLSKELQQKITKVNMGLVAVLVLLWGFIFFNPANRIDASEAQTLMSQLYIDDNQEMINTNLTKDEFNAIQQKLDRHRPSHAKLNEAEEKFELHELMTSIYHPESLNEEPHFNQTVSAETVDQATNYLEQVDKEDVFYKEATTLVQNAQEDLTKMDLFHNEIDLSKAPIVKERADIPEAVSFVSQYDDTFVGIEEHAPTFPVIAEYQAYLDDLCEVIVDEFTTQYFSDEFLDEMYQVDSLASRFELTPMDPGKLVALTFDDGPNEEYTTQVLEILEEHDIVGTFFVMGAYVDDSPHIAREIVERGHIIGNHTYNHPDLAVETPEEVLKQYRWTTESIYDETGVMPDLFRLPFGSGGPREIELAGDMTSIMWNTDSADWELQDAEAIFENVKNNLHRHSVILMHDTAQYTVDALKLIIPYLKEEGYRFVEPTQVDFYRRF